MATRSWPTALIITSGALVVAACTSGSPDTTTTEKQPEAAASASSESPTTPAGPPGTPPYNPAGVNLQAFGKPLFFGSVPKEFYGKKKRVMYLTFDDGPDPTYTPQILDVLKKHDAKATFLVLGKHVEQHPNIMTDIYTAGHAVGSHTWDHKNLAKLSAADVEQQMTDTDNALGARTTCMRPPYGSTRQATRDQLTAMGKWVMHWDLGSGDWQRRSAAEIADTLITGATPGALTLMHDGGGPRDATVDGVDQALTALGQDGWTFEVLPMCQLEPLGSADATSSSATASSASATGSATSNEAAD